MTELTHQSMYAFQKRFAVRGGSLRGFVVRRFKNQTQVRFTLRVLDQPTKQATRVRFTMHHVEEFRFQRRPGPSSLPLTGIQFGFFGNLVYVNLDPFTEDGPPKVMDFRASDWFVAGVSLFWEEVPRKNSST